MTLSLYMDENVPRQITYGLRLRKIDVLTVQEDQRAGTPNPEILIRVTELQRILFTRDEDFLVLANSYQQQAINFTGVIYAPQQIVSIGDCIHDLEMIAQACDPEDFFNVVQYLPL